MAIEYKKDKTIYFVPLDDIDISHLNVRPEEEALIEIDDLAKSIEELGQLQPVVLIGNPDKKTNQKHKIIVGQRRFLAHKKLAKKNPKYNTIRAEFIPKPEELIEATVISLAENMQREPLSYDTTIKAVSKVYDHYKNIRRVSQILGVSESFVREHLNINRLVSEEGIKKFKKIGARKEDIKRILKITRGSESEALKFYDRYKALPKSSIDSAIEIARESPDEKTSEILDKASKQRIKFTIILTLDDLLKDAVMSASSKYNESKESIAMLALREWLKGNGFLNNE